MPDFLMSKQTTYSTDSQNHSQDCIDVTKIPAQFFSLLALKKTHNAYIDSIVANPAFGELDDLVTKRLLDLGFQPNTPIKVITKSLFGKPPIAVQIADGAQFSLRKEEAEKIRCRAL